VTLTPQLERRRALRRQQRQQLLIQLWRVVVLLLLSTGLGWILLRHGWTLEGTNQVIVRGDTGISPDLVSKVGGLSFPQPLLEINLKTLEAQLRQELPVQSAQAERRLLPARLDVQLVGQIPVARATRRLAGGMETGMVDGEGHWIQTNTKAPSPAPSSAITVEGWSADKRPVLAELLEQRGRISDNLEAIVLHPDGAISLRTRRLGLINLGRDSDRLVQQIDALVQLNRTMPPHLLEQGKGSIDLSNPEAQAISERSSGSLKR
jgi:cell division protein FtsQ